MSVDAHVRLRVPQHDGHAHQVTPHAPHVTPVPRKVTAVSASTRTPQDPITGRSTTAARRPEAAERRGTQVPTSGHGVTFLGGAA